MNIRNVYLFLIVVLSLGLFFEWSSEKKNLSIENHLLDAKSSVFDIGDGYVVVENEELYVVVEVQTGKIVETRIKKECKMLRTVERVIEFIDSSERGLAI